MNNNLPDFFLIDLIHFTQRFNWDCGIACILMILQTEIRKYFLENFRQICNEENFEESTWTIDLCYLLKRFNIKHKYMTLVTGVNPKYNECSYYTEILLQDEKRVTEKFLKANENKICVEKKSISTLDLLNHLNNHGPVILLTNSSLLSCDICKKNKLKLEFSNFIKPTFNGHYIILCGFNLKVKKFFYRNPGNSDRICVMSFEKMTKARQDNGTDEDAILIFK